MRHADRRLPLTVIHRDEDLLVVLKPSGLATTSPDGGDCLAARVQEMDPDAERCHPSSRLDSDVTGVVVFARSSRGIDVVVGAREDGLYARRYLGLAHAPDTRNALASSSFDWRWSIAIDRRDPRLRVALRKGERGERMQDAHTRARVVARSAGAWSLVFEPVTGRTHQLRVHASRAGMPLLGDVAYGGLRRLVARDGRITLCPRVALHCACVVLPKRDGSLHAFRAPLPDDLVALGAELGLAPFDEDAIEADARASIAAASC